MAELAFYTHPNCTRAKWKVNSNLLIVFVCVHIFSESIPYELAEVNPLAVIVLTRVLFLFWCYINNSILSYLSSIVSLNFIQFVGIFPADIYDRLTAYAISGKKKKKYVDSLTISDCVILFLIPKHRFYSLVLWMWNVTAIKVRFTHVHCYT